MSAKPREVSSNDPQLDPESEYSSQCQPVQEKRKQRQHTKYQCPADFVFCNFRPCASTRLESVNDGNTELWLIKAPVTFNPDSFSGIKVPMMGLETIQPHAGHQQVYSFLSRPVVVGNSRLLTTDGQQPGNALCAPAFSGIINICESYGDCMGNQTPVAIPACPAPLIPEGLKQRFQPFGSRTPSSQGSKVREQQEEEQTDCPTAAKCVRMHPEDSKTPKKKKKKEKRIEVEQEEMVEKEVLAAVSHGLTGTTQELAPGVEAVEKKKKKKDKRMKMEQEEMVEEEVLAAVSHGLTGTSLELDPGEEAVEKKRKKKKDKRIKMEQEEMVEEQVLVAVSHSLMETSQELAPGEEAMEKKRKRKKDKRIKMEQEEILEEEVLAVVSHGLMETSQELAPGEEAMEKKRKKKKDKRIKMEQEEMVEEEVLAAVSHSLMETSQELAPGEEAMEKKRKKKKDKRIKMEQEEMVEEEVLAAVSHSLMETSQELALGEEVMEKKRKKSKDTDRREMEEGSRGVEMALRFKQEELVKTEPLDFACSDMQNLMKKKKKVNKEKRQSQD